MADRPVTRVRKDRDGEIIALGKPGAWWAPRFKQEVIRDIEGQVHSYHVPWLDGRRTPIRAVNGPAGKYLRADRDSTARNNLEDLPRC